MKKITLLSVLFIVHLFVQAKVPLKSVVEHYTNTKCGICANRNPGFNTNYNNSVSGILRLSIHPSSPYAACPLSMQNKMDNDARTNFYTIYGGTPRLVINGSVIPSSANYSLPSLFTPYQNLTSSFELKMMDIKFGTDSIHSMITIKKVDTSSLSAALLFLGLVEDTIFVNGGNGETEHYNVLRKAVTAPQGLSISLPINVGDSITFQYSTNANVVWNFGRIYSISLLQNSLTKELIQAERTMADASTTGINNTTMNSLNLSVYPNPCTNILKLYSTEKGNLTTELFDMTGKKKISKTFSRNEFIDVSALPSGIYILKTTHQNNKTNFQKVYVQN
ncbi:MAG: hypothetical protein RIQ33_904 [Bacteroidota bacterium]